MKASNIFMLKSDLKENFELTNQKTEHIEILNETEEKLTTQLFVNEEISNGYVHCRMVIDEIVDLSARAFNRNLTQLIVQNSYGVYFNTENGNLISLSNKKVADRAKEIFESSFQLKYDKHAFDLNEIMNNSSNVKGAKFKNLKIQTISGGQLNGNKVDETAIYDLMANNGELSTVILTYPFNYKDISFSISNKGSLVLYSTLEDSEYINLIEDLLAM